MRGWQQGEIWFYVGINRPVFPSHLTDPSSLSTSVSFPFFAHSPVSPAIPTVRLICGPPSLSREKIYSTAVQVTGVLKATGHMSGKGLFSLMPCLNIMTSADKVSWAVIEPAIVVPFPLKACQMDLSAFVILSSYAQLCLYLTWQPCWTGAMCRADEARPPGLSVCYEPAVP